MKEYQIDDARLCERLDVSRHVEQCFREEHMRGVRLLAGNRYSPNAADKKRYLNLISLYVNIVGRTLFSNSPRVMLSTFDRQQKPAVSAAETWMNLELVRQNFAGIMKRVVLDALFSIGISKVGIATPADSALVGWNLQAGKPFMSRINLDDFVFDHRARDFDECGYIGNRIRVPLEAVKNDKSLSKKARDRLEPSTQIQYNANTGDERIGEIGRQHYGADEDLEDMIELWEVYLPRHRTVKLFTEDDLSGPTSSWNGSKPVPLDEKQWIGPESGPYPLLAYQLVPGQIFPKGPLQDLIELDEGANEGYRKLMRQAARLKVNPTFRAENPEDGKNLKEANDGESVGLTDPNAVKEVVQGGIHPGLFQWTRDVVERFMLHAGNLLTMGGLAPQAGTLGQEELLATQSNGQVAAMQDVTVAYVSKVCDSMLWYYWNDPRLVMTAPLNDPRITEVDVVRKVHPWNHPNPKAMKRTGPVPDLKIDPYSIRHMTPQQRLKDLMQIVTQIYIPLAGEAKARGIAFDIHSFFGIIAKYMDAPDLLSILTIQEQLIPEAGNATSADNPSKPASTSREYIRRSLGGGSKQNKDMEADNAIASMASGNGESNGQLY